MRRLVFAQQLFLAGLALGAGATWFLDPQSGARRRAMVRDRTRHLTHELAEATRVGSRDLVNRAEGIEATLAGLRKPPPTDGKLERRVRAIIGHVSSHPGAIRVQVDGHRVQLEGPVMEDEAQEVVERVARTRGVEEVVNALEPHADPSHVSALQGEHRRGRPGRFPPAAHLVLSVASGLMAIGMLVRGSTIGFAAGVLGVLANAAAITQRNRPFRDKTKDKEPPLATAPAT
jgi:hypothetical protein